MAGTGTGIFSPRGDGDGEATSDGEFPVAIFRIEGGPMAGGLVTHVYGTIEEDEQPAEAKDEDSLWDTDDLSLE